MIKKTSRPPTRPRGQRTDATPPSLPVLRRVHEDNEQTRPRGQRTNARRVHEDNEQTPRTAARCSCEQTRHNEQTATASTRTTTDRSGARSTCSGSKINLLREQDQVASGAARSTCFGSEINLPREQDQLASGARSTCFWDRPGTGDPRTGRYSCTFFDRPGTPGEKKSYR